MIKKRGLGRGLEALLGDMNKTVNTADNLPENSKIEGELVKLPLEVIHAGKYQPRKSFSEESIQELADSLRSQGIIQPIIVRSVGNNHYEIVAGERRFRAAKLAGLTAIPALVRELPDEAAVALALIENIQREDLNPMEEASGLQRLIDDFAMTHQQAANAVGKSRTAVTNLLRLLHLEYDVQKMLELGELEMGHARALLALTGTTQISTAKTIAEKKLSVRDAEQLVKRMQNLQSAHPRAKTLDPLLHDLQMRIATQLAAKIQIQQNAKGQGKLIIKYKNPQHLQQLLEKMRVEV